MTGCCTELIFYMTHVVSELARIDDSWGNLPVAHALVASLAFAPIDTQLPRHLIPTGQNELISCPGREFRPMGDVVSLRTARKKAARQRAAEQAAANRVLHGKSKAERALLQAKKKKAETELDQHRIDTGDGR
jgi:hypothetical protein